MLLADLGADVIRVDRPHPAADGVEAPDPRADLFNRGKRSLALDLKKREAVETFLTLARHAEVVTEGFRPGVVERLGIGPHNCAAVNPRLIYARMTGWGQDGPLSASAGHDINYIALTGALHAIGPEDGPPQIPLNLVGDLAGGGNYLVIGILAALAEARRNGVGQVIDAAITDGTAHLLAGIRGMLAEGLWQDNRGGNVLDGAAPFYTVYQTAEGGHMAVGAGENKFYRELLRILDIDEDPATQYDRTRWPTVRERFSTVFGTKTRAEWTTIFDGTDACVTPVLSIEEAAEHPHNTQRGTIVERHGIQQPAPAPRFSRTTETGWGAPPPRPGEHSLAVLDSWGVDRGADLVTRGVVTQFEPPATAPHVRW